MKAAAQGWGRLFRPQERQLRLRDRFERPVFEPGQHYLARGAGRSYGDVAINDGGQIFDTDGLDRFIAFDEHSGVLEAEAGLRLAELIALCLPRGWFLPVTPGTQQVSLGGAVANDVHGKNHHQAGSFGCHLLGLDLLRSDGQVYHCSPQENSGLYAATIGGLGLTGLILSVRLRLLRVPGAALRGDSLRFANLAEYFALDRESAAHWPYTVAWVDCSARARQLGRGVYERARHDAGPPPPAPRALPLAFTPPLSPLNAWSLRVFNSLYYHRPSAQQRERLWHCQSFFYPLDRIAHWNRLYGPRGFYQFQCLLPPETAQAGIAALLARIAASAQGSMLAVLKTFGSRRSPGLLSFAGPGTSLALDFANRGASTLALLRELETISLDAGGRLYPAKDACMSPTALRRGYPALPAFLQHVDPAFSSSLWRRLSPSCTS